MIAEGYNKPRIVNGDIILDVKYYYSQDAVKWVDLAKVDPEVANHARSLSGRLSGEVAPHVLALHELLYSIQFFHS